MRPASLRPFSIAPTDNEITALKRQKLQIKDQIHASNLPCQGAAIVLRIADFALPHRELYASTLLDLSVIPCCRGRTWGGLLVSGAIDDALRDCATEYQAVLVQQQPAIEKRIKQLETDLSQQRAALMAARCAEALKTI